MQNNIFLIGGGEIAKGETRLIDAAIKRSAPRKSNGKFLFFPTSAQDNLKYIDVARQVFGKRFAFQAVVLSDSEEMVRRTIMESAIIYFGGGKTEYLLSLFDRWQLLPVLKSAIKKGTIVVGMSAGAQALSAWYADIEGGKVAWKQGWGIVNLGCFVHAQEQTAKVVFNEFQKLGLMPQTPFVAISERTAWIVSSKSGKTYGAGHIWFGRNGKLQKI